MPDRSGEVFAGRYRLTRRLGEGGMGEVYEARHVFLERRVAVKLLREEYARHERHLHRFEREAKSLASLHSHHIVQVTDFGATDAGLPFMVMEYLEGEDLRQRLNRRQVLPAAETLSLVLDACEGVGDAHAQGLIHRDLKPENLFITKGRGGGLHCKILDFGVAKLRDAATFTRDGALVGTVQYMAPEQALGQKDLDGRVDVFALGAILFECLSGVPAFDGDKPEVILFKILHDAPPPLRSLNPDLPPALERIVHRALSRETEARYPTVAALAAALVDSGATARRPTSVGEMPEFDASNSGNSDRAELPRSLAESEIRDRTRKRTGARVLFALGLLFVVGLALAWWDQADEGRRPIDRAAAGEHPTQPASPNSVRGLVPSSPARQSSARALPDPKSRTASQAPMTVHHKKRLEVPASASQPLRRTASSKPAASTPTHPNDETFDLDPNPYK